MALANKTAQKCITQKNNKQWVTLKNFGKL